MRRFRESVPRRRWLLWPSLAVLAAFSSPGLLLAQAREGLLLEYRFDGDSRDSSGNGHHGTVHGDPEFASGTGRSTSISLRWCWLRIVGSISLS
jgi:hypothetical protein